MFSIEAESIVNKTWIIFNRAIEDKMPVLPMLEEHELTVSMIEDAVSSYIRVKNRKPDVFARAMLLKGNYFEVLLELKEMGTLISAEWY